MKNWLYSDWVLAGRQVSSSLMYSNIGGVFWGLGMTSIAGYKTALYPLFYLLGK